MIDWTVSGNTRSLSGRVRACHAILNDDHAVLEEPMTHFFNE